MGVERAEELGEMADGMMVGGLPGRVQERGAFHSLLHPGNGERGAPSLAAGAYPVVGASPAVGACPAVGASPEEVEPFPQGGGEAWSHVHCWMVRPLIQS